MSHTRYQGPYCIYFSISAFTVSTNRAEYCILKAAWSMRAQIYVQRLAPEGIVVFEIQPGIIRADMVAAVEQAYEDKIADGHLNYCAGQILHVDGGFRLRSL